MPAYDQAKEQVTRLLDMMGGMGAFVADGEKIVLKANLLAAAAPQKAVTTHPAIVTAVGRLVTARGRCRQRRTAPDQAINTQKKT